MAPNRELNLDLLRLAVGCHDGPDSGGPGDMCLLEACAWMAGEPWSDSPQCVSPVLGAFGRPLNDRLDSDRRQRLVPLIPAMLGTAGDGLDEVRRHLAVDWSVRVAAPLWLDAAGRGDLAAELRVLAPITDRAGREAIRPRLREISDACWSARREALARVREAAKVADPAAVAAAVAAVAVAADAAAAVAAADAAAAVAAVAADAVAERRSLVWQQTHDRVYHEIKQQVTERYEPTRAQAHDSAIEVFTAMVRPIETPGARP